jgi:hypothetical protein
MKATTELDQRESNGITVTLLWNRKADTLAVRVFDQEAGEHFELAASRDEALEVFRHPFAYAATRPIRYFAPEARLLAPAGGA